MKFVYRSSWKPSRSSVICVKHFQKEYTINGQRKKLKWKMQPVSTLQTAEALKRPSTLPNTILPRKAPKVRMYQDDELSSYETKDIITCFADLCSRDAPNNYFSHETYDYVIYYNLVFDEKSGFQFWFGFTAVEKSVPVSVSVLLTRTFGFWVLVSV